MSFYIDEVADRLLKLIVRLSGGERLITTIVASVHLFAGRLYGWLFTP